MQPMCLPTPAWPIPFEEYSAEYRGFFSTIPYYLKVREYRDIENRDIWEYRLNFTEHRVRRLLMHAWELGNASFDYYFFKENCSYHLLALLDYADPTLHLADEFLFWTVPADTVRVIASKPGLVSDIAYPAFSEQYDPAEAQSPCLRRNGRSLIGSQEDIGELTSPDFVSVGSSRGKAFLLGSRFRLSPISDRYKPIPLHLELKERNHGSS